MAEEEQFMEWKNIWPGSIWFSLLGIMPGTIDDDVFAGDREVSVFLKDFHGSAHGLSRTSNHMREFLEGWSVCDDEFSIDTFPLGLAQSKEALGDSSIDVKHGQAADLLIGLPKPLG